MNNVEKEIKRLSASRIEGSLPPIESLDKIPAKAEKPRKTPLILVPIAAAALTAAVVAPIVAFSLTRSSFHYVENDELLTFLAGKINRHSEEEKMPMTFNYVMRSNQQIGLVQYDFDASKSGGKIAVTLSQRGVNALSFVQKGEKWQTIESEIINMYGGCIIDYDVMSDLRCVYFDMNEKVPCQIDGRYVIALYYEGESFLVEELTQSIGQGEKQKEYFSIIAKEGESGYLEEEVPEPYSIQRLYAANDLAKEDGSFHISRIRERYCRIGEVSDGVLTANYQLFSGLKDPLGELSPLINENKVDYKEFKRILPDYLERYRGEEYRKPKDVPFAAKSYECHEDLPKMSYIFRDIEEWKNYGNCQIIEKYTGTFEEVYFEDRALLLLGGPRQDDNAYYDLEITKLVCQEGSLIATAKMNFVEGKYGGSFLVAELQESDLAMLDESYVAFYLITSER